MPALIVARVQRRKRGGKVSRKNIAVDDLASPDSRNPLELLAVHEVLERLAANT